MNRDAHIVVVGSFAVGLTMKTDRFPSAGETVLGSNYRTDHGGKGSNQAVGCARLGAKVSFVARIGEDPFGEMALRLYREEGVDAKWVKQTAERPTGVGFILVKLGSGENCIALDPGANDLLAAVDVAESDSTLAGADVVLTQLEIPASAAQAAMAYGRAHCAITVLNPAPARPLQPALLQNVEILTPNEAEAKVLLGHRPDAGIDPSQLAHELLRLGPRNVVVTLGEQGAFIATRAWDKEVPAIKVPTVDTTGAGDAFNAGLAVALAHGADLEAAVNLAVITGGLAVTKDGVVPALPRWAEVLAYCEQSGLTVPETAQW
jgi:ribokinase